MKRPPLRIAFCLGIIGVLFLAGRAGLVVARQPCVGVADNLDYWRVAHPAGIDVESQPKQGYFLVCHYETRDGDLLTSLTTPALIAWLTRNLAARDDTQFDLRHLGFVYWAASLAILAAALLGGCHPLLVLLVAAVLYDPGFFLFFNSLYADPALIVGFSGALLILLSGLVSAPNGSREARRRTLALVSILAMALLAGLSKMQYSVFPAVLAACCAVELVLRKPRLEPRHWALLGGLIVAAVIAPLHFLYGPAPRFLDANNFNAVFGGIVRVSTDPATALQDLRIDPAELQRQPRDFFAGRRADVERVLPQLRSLSRLHLAMLYLRDPGATWRTVREIHSELARVRTHPRGNYTQGESGRRARFFQWPAQLTVWRSWLFYRVPLWSPLLLLTCSTFLIHRAWLGRWAGIDSGVLLLILWSVSQFAVAVLGEGFVNLHQHLLGARLATDLLLGLSLVRLALWAASSLASRRRHPSPTSPRHIG